MSWYGWRLKAPEYELVATPFLQGSADDPADCSPIHLRVCFYRIPLTNNELFITSTGNLLAFAIEEARLGRRGPKVQSREEFTVVRGCHMSPK